MTEGYICTSSGKDPEIEAVILPVSASPAALVLACRLGGAAWVQDEYLSKCWHRRVFCTRFFSALWRNKHSERPNGFRFVLYDERRSTGS